MKFNLSHGRSALFGFATVGLALTLTALSSHAAIIVVDSVDGTSVSISHLGSDNVALTGFATINRIDITGDDTPTLGADGSNNSFTDGTTGITPTTFAIARFYVASSAFALGTGPGLNYARFDFDGDSTYETVVEFDFGVDATFAGDVITRYAYDDTGASLDIPAAVVEFNAVPEPSSMLYLLLCGGTAVLRRRRK